jgi:hypothetical protein
MHRGWALLLCVYLLGWVPLNFANELFGSVGSLDMRGWRGTIELAAHAVVTMMCAAAGWSLRTGAPAGRTLAIAAVLASAFAAVQSLYWTVLPRNLAPGDRLPLAALATAHASFWLFMLTRRPTTSA